MEGTVTPLKPLDNYLYYVRTTVSVHSQIYRSSKDFGALVKTYRGPSEKINLTPSLAKPFFPDTKDLSSSTGSFEALDFDGGFDLDLDLALATVNDFDGNLLLVRLKGEITCGPLALDKSEHSRPTTESSSECIMVRAWFRGLWNGGKSGRDLRSTRWILLEEPA